MGIDLARTGTLGSVIMGFAKRVERLRVDAEQGSERIGQEVLRRLNFRRLVGRCGEASSWRRKCDQADRKYYPSMCIDEEHYDEPGRQGLCDAIYHKRGGKQ
jgi:hypothetical protein